MIWNPAIECIAPGDLKRLQGDLLARLVARVYERVPFYKRRLDEAGIRPGGVRGLADLARLPFTNKSDLRDHYPFGLFAVPLDQVVRLHASSGTTGKPLVVGYSRKDLRLWAEVCARSLALSGAEAGQMFQNAYGYGLFTGGLGMHAGAELMGLTVVPASGGNTARQIMLMQDFGTEVMACTPSYALTLADAIEERAIPIDTLKLRIFLLGAEPWTEEMRREIQSRLHVNAINIYGISEIIGPGVSNECLEARDGSHICEDHFLAEVIDPKTEQPLGEGEVGELVFTTLTKEALPLIRYRTGDLASLTGQPCPCGRTLSRMSRLVGRVDDMLIIRGVNVFPSQVEAALVGADLISPHYQLVVKREKHRDELEVRIEVCSSFFQRIGAEVFAGHTRGGVNAIRQLEQKIEQRVREALGLNVNISLAAPNSLPRSEGGKLNRVVDQRLL